MVRMAGFDPFFYQHSTSYLTRPVKVQINSIQTQFDTSFYSSDTLKAAAAATTTAKLKRNNNNNNMLLVILPMNHLLHL